MGNVFYFMHWIKYLISLFFQWENAQDSSVVAYFAYVFFTPKKRKKKILRILGIFQKNLKIPQFFKKKSEDA